MPGPDPAHWLHRLTAEEWLAAAATECLDRGEHGCLVGLIRGEVRTTPLADVVGMGKTIDLKLLQLQKVLAQ